MIGVLLRAAPDLLSRVLGLIHCKFPIGCLQQVNMQLIAQPDQVNECIGEFFRHLCLFGPIEIPALLFSKPLEMLNDFSHLDRKCHGQIFWRVELFPVAVTGELA